MRKKIDISILVDQYISRFPAEIQERLLMIRAIIRQAAPEAEETFAYQMPTYRLGDNLVHFAGYNNHIGFYPTPSGIAAYAKELSSYRWAKGSIQFPHNKPLPTDLIRQIVEHRVAENSRGGTQKGKQISLTDKAVEKATGKGWDEWFSILYQEEADKLQHKEIALLLSKKFGVDGWWAQSITVEYERHLGKRQVGQAKSGTFQTAVSKTMPGSLDQVFNLWLEAVKDTEEFNSIPLAEKPAISKTEKWRYWRANLKDGSKITITVGLKSEDKSMLTFSNEKLKDQDAIEPWKAFWKDYLKKL
ncbi:MAG: hypothetical protein FJ152_03625 [Firmicutes bacterium]|nr:hypothetical protein [Bacillota bacterium]